MADFVASVVWKTLMVGSGFVVVSALVLGPAFGVSVFAGVVLTAGNLAALGWFGRKIVEGVTERGKRRYVWIALLILKMFLLLALAFFAMAVLGIHPIGFAVGYSAFIFAACWQAFTLYAS